MPKLHAQDQHTQEKTRQAAYALGASQDAWAKAFERESSKSGDSTPLMLAQGSGSASFIEGQALDSFLAGWMPEAKTAGGTKITNIPGATIVAGSFTGAAGYSPTAVDLSARLKNILADYREIAVCELMTRQALANYFSEDLFLSVHSDWQGVLAGGPRITEAAHQDEVFIEGAEYEISLPAIKNTVYQCEAEIAYIRTGAHTLALSPDEWDLLRGEDEQHE